MARPTKSMTDPRPPYFAMRVLRLATKTALAQHHGTDVLALLTIIACTEDARRYRGPVAYWNEQLLPLVGFGKWERLDRARQKLIDAGWLLYEPGGRHKAGLYRVTIPRDLADVIDAAVDESSSPKSGYQGESSSPESGYQQIPSVSLSGVSTGGTSGVSTGGTFLPVPRPIPEESASLLSSPSSVLKTKTKSKPQKQLAIPDQLDTLIAAWNQLPDGIAPRCVKRTATTVTAWTRANRQSGVQDALSDVAKLMAAIRDGSFLHGQPWFNFSWLFHKSRSGEFNAVKIIEGNYRDSNAKPHASAARWQGDADDFAHLATPAPAAAAAGAGCDLESRTA
ncbi:MAG: hypothetical protein ACKV2Q_19265 [Planctomycetaceae bacterium]